MIDWEQPANNDFLLVSQFSVTGALYPCRPDLVGFVNGLPLVVIELKKPDVPARGVRRESDALQTANFGVVLVQRSPQRLERHGQPRRITHGGLGAVLRVDTHRARGRAAPGDHCKTRQNANQRLNSAWFGESARTKSRAFTVALDKVAAWN